MVFQEQRETKWNQKFDLVSYNAKELMRVLVTEPFQHLNGEAAVGFVMKWTIKNTFPKATSQRNYKDIFILSAGESSEIQLKV